MLSNIFFKIFYQGINMKKIIALVCLLAFLTSCKDPIETIHYDLDLQDSYEDTSDICTYV